MSESHPTVGPILRSTAVLCIALLAVSCGGGDDSAPASAAPTRLVRPQAQVTPTGFPAGPIPADANQKGMWSPVYSWPVIAVHAVLMPDGRVLTYGTDATGKQTAYFIYDVWDPSAGPSGGHMTLPNATATDIFCSSQVVLPQSGAGVFIAGGDNWTGTSTTNTGNNNSNVFSYSANTLTRGNNMNRARWYSSSTVLISGEVYTQGGSGGTDRPEVRGSDGTFRLLSTADTSAFDFMYPRNFVAPDARIFGYDSAGRMYYIDPTGTGAVANVGQFGSAYTGNDASAAMFRPGRILQFGGNSNGAIVIDITSGAPVVTPTQSMSSQRRLVTATMLPDGKVLATGGSQVWNDLTGVNNIAEIWNPQTGLWTQGSSGALARLYHSTALLMADGSVLVMGGGAPGPLNNLNIEVYYPPYLFTADGALAPRPVITTAPDALEIGKTFTLDFTDASTVSRVALVKTGSVTHSWNMEQRYIDLTFNVSGSRLNVQAPARATDATPGNYLLFIIDGNGVPSVAKMVRINVAAVPNPGIMPTLVNPGNRTDQAGASVNVQLNASDPNGDTLIFAATGLPPGITIDNATGRMTGTPTTQGTFNVVVSASDGVNVASAAFVWTIATGTPLAIDPLPPPAPLQSGTTVTFTATANGFNTLYKWDFGDGSPETAWSSSGSAVHQYARAGVFYVTVTAIDDRGVQTSQMFLQMVYLPPASQRPTASSSLVYEQPASGNARIWVVNQDNDSVTVFDAVTRTKLREITVGTAPRSIAQAQNGMLWVANKLGGSISVIDPVSLAVSRTIALPRASQPFGIAMVPGASMAFVALEATGQVLRFDTGSYAQTGAANVGANPRHVAVSADGASAYVSLFITPPLPGEATASVQTTVNNVAVGGQVVQLSTSSMGIVRTVVLAHSERDDSEISGRGIPNYLGAPALSPDATQGFVPSKQDNIKRGALRDGSGLNFQNTARAISSRIDLGAGAEDLASRVDHDNASLASAAVFDQYGVYLFVALETSREVAVINAHARTELFRFDVGRAPQALALSADGKTLYVNNFMDRTVSVFDLKPLVDRGMRSVSLVATLSAVTTERLTAQVLLGKQLFYDARDTRLARDRYLSCATCHNDGGHDGRVWDLTGFGEGLRNTINLRGRAAMGQGYLHWSANFDEVQDFEGQIRQLAGGTGLMTDTAFNSGTRNQPLGTTKAGVSTDLDALAAYVASLSSFASSPFRSSTGALSTAATAGKTVFTNLGCGACHAGAAFTGSGINTLVNVGTIKPSSGTRLGATLTGIDVPTLRDVWATAPFLHDGSAATLGDAVRAHNGVTVSDADLANLVAYLREIGGEEASAPIRAGTGTGLTGRYYNNKTMTGTVRLTRIEAVDFTWGSAKPGPNVNANSFSVRWTGFVEAPATGTYVFQTISDDGVRLWVNGVQLVNNWTDHSATTNTAGPINLVAGARYAVTMEFYENGGAAVARLLWRTPGNTTFAAVPKDRLFPN
ncbi:MAG TPA: PA14 domain-containing protein [Burkholderiaceae bacterium]|nr:PA14 domain-containing protein [Burkholderiaceae bacterium]